MPNPDINTVGGIVGAVVENADNVGLGLLPGKPTGTSSGGGGDDDKKPDGSGKPAATTDSSLLATVGETPHYGRGGTRLPVMTIFISFAIFCSIVIQYNTIQY